jgi:tetratricopeptide (TPR) repeat protein
MKHFVFAFGAVLVVASLASAEPPAQPAAQQQQQQQQPPPPQNLQILPKDTTREQLLQTMQAFTQALGVQCNYCHVQEGRGGRNDMASDEKRTKLAARQMMVLARDINQKLPAAVNKPAEEATRVSCATCHRGVPIPRALADILTDTEKDKGIDAAIAQYWDLRKNFFGRAAYDFGEPSLIAAATRLTSDEPDAALKLLEINTQFFPNSSRSYAAMSQAHMKKNDKEQAIKDLEKAAALDPQNAGLKRQLDQLKGPTGE